MVEHYTMRTREKFIQKKLDARKQVLSISPRQGPKDIHGLLEIIDRDTVDDYQEEFISNDMRFGEKSRESENSIFNFDEEDSNSSNDSEYQSPSRTQRKISQSRSSPRTKSSQDRRSAPKSESHPPRSSRQGYDGRTSSRETRSSTRESDRCRTSSRQSDSSTRESDRFNTSSRVTECGSSSYQSRSPSREVNTRTTSRNSRSSTRESDYITSSQHSPSRSTKYSYDELYEQHRSSSRQSRLETRGSSASQNRPSSSIISKILDETVLPETGNFISLTQAETNSDKGKRQRGRSSSITSGSLVEGKAGSSAEKWAEKMAYRNSTVDELLRYGDSYFNKESYDAAKTRYVAAIHKAKQTDLVDERIADAHVRLAAILSRGDDVKQMLHHSNSALQIYEDLYLQQVKKKENVDALGKKIIDVTTSIANYHAEQNDVDASLLAFKHAIVRTQRCFPHDVNSNIKAMNAYAYALSFTADNHSNALDIMDGIITQYYNEKSNDELMKSFIIKGKILLNRSRSTTLHSIQKNDAIEAQECFMKAMRMCKLHPAKFSADETTNLIVLIRSAKDMQRVTTPKKSVVIADKAKCKDHDDDDRDNGHMIDYQQRINQSDSDSLCSTDADAEDGLSVFHGLKRYCKEGCQWLFDFDDE